MNPYNVPATTNAAFEPVPVYHVEELQVEHIEISALTSLINETIFTESGEIALVTRANLSHTQLYGIFCTGPLVDSMNSAGEPNEFLLTPADGEI